jgi:uncharacterized membrane protein YbhN (UPF0104 family)
MSRPLHTRRPASWLLTLLRLGALGVGTWLIVRYHATIADAATKLGDLSPLVLLALPLFWLWNHVASIGWHGLVRATGHPAPPSTWKLSLIRIQGQAVNLAVPLASVGGEALKSTLLSRRQGALAPGVSSVGLDLASSTAAAALFFVGGMALHSGALPLTPALRLVITGAALALAVALLNVPALAERLIRRLRPRPGTSLARLRDALARNPRALGRAFRRASTWHLAERVLTAGEIYIAAVALDVGLGLLDALFATALMTGFTLVFFFIPAQAGAAEGALSMAFSALGLSPTAGLAVALVRRGRQAVVCALGLSLLLIGSRDHGPRTRSSADAPTGREQNKQV